MPTQTGSIDLKSSNAIRTYAAAGFSNAETTYSTKSELSQTATGITSTVERLTDTVKGGGRNLLVGTEDAVTWTVSLNSSNYMVRDCYKTVLPVPSLFSVDENVTISFDWETNATEGSFHLECGAVTPYTWGTVVSATGTRNSTSNYVDLSSSNTSGHASITFKVTSSQTSAAATLQWFRIRVDGANTSGKTFKVSHAMCERGTIETAWDYSTSDLSLMKTRISQTESGISLAASKLETVANPNLSPFFESAPYRTATTYDGGYWQPTTDNWLMNGVTQLTEGWAHVEVGASKNIEIAIPRIETLAAGDRATLLFEWKNVTVTGSPSLYARNYSTQCQFNQNSYSCSWSTSSAVSGEKRVTMTVNSTAVGTATWNCAINLAMSNGSSVSFAGDLRISIYKETYDTETSTWIPYSGPWKPYSGNQLYASQSELKVQTDRIGMVVQNSDASSSLVLTPGAINAVADSFNINGTLTVGAIGNLSVGGRNLLLGTKDMAGWGATNGTTISGGVVTFPTVTADTWREIYPAKNFRYSEIRNQTVTFSAKVLATSGASCSINLCIGVETTETAYARKKYRNQLVNFTGTGKWETVKATATVTDSWFSSGSGTVDFDNCWVTVRPGAKSDYRTGFQAKEFMLELSTVPSDYSPAPDDLAATATNYITQIDSNGIKIANADPSTATSYLKQTSSGTQIVKGGYLKANYADTITLYGGSNASGTYPKAEVSSSAVKMYQSANNHADVTSSGLTVYQGGSDVASFGSTARIGKVSGESRMELDYHSLQMVDKDDNTYFHVSDLRDADGYITDTFKGDGGATRFSLTGSPSSDITVTVDGATVTSGVTTTDYAVVFTTAPPSGSIIKVKHKVHPSFDSKVKAYTFGARAENSTIGPFSVAEGYDTEARSVYAHAEGFETIAGGQCTHAEGISTLANGNYSHAEGSNTRAIGTYSHAEGSDTRAVGTYSHAQNLGTHTNGDAQTAIGKYNEIDYGPVYAFIIGNGTADDARSNALAVKWDGTIVLENDSTLWDNSNGNTHLLTPESGKTAQAEYSFEAVGLYIRKRTRTSATAAWSSWSSWTLIS